VSIMTSAFCMELFSESGSGFGQNGPAQRGQRSLQRPSGQLGHGIGDGSPGGAWSWTDGGSQSGDLHKAQPPHRLRPKVLIDPTDHLRGQMLQLHRHWPGAPNRQGSLAQTARGRDLGERGSDDSGPGFHELGHTGCCAIESVTGYHRNHGGYRARPMDGAGELRHTNVRVAVRYPFPGHVSRSRIVGMV
jgi:hypothetical protein